MDELSELRQELKRDFRDFLEQDFGIETGQGKYAQQIQDILKDYPTTKRLRLEVDLQGGYGWNLILNFEGKSEVVIGECNSQELVPFICRFG